MKIAVVDWDIAYPANSGKRLRTLNLMLQLARRHELTYVSRGHGDTDEGRAATEFFGEHGVQTAFAGMPAPGKSGWQYYVRLARNLASNEPFAVAAHQQADFQKWLREYASTNQFDAWQLEWSPYVEMLQGVAGAATCLVAHNVDSLIWRRYADAESGALKRAYILEQHRRFDRFERRAFRAADRVVAVSDEDARLAKELFEIDTIDVVENGVDLERFGAVQREPNPHELLFLGSLDWRPNADALRVLLDDVLPAVLKQRPQARLSVVGRNAPAWLVERADASEEIELHADVPDVRPYLARAGMLVVPLRIGGGSRLKILEALAGRVPVVATAVAAEGLELDPATDYARAEIGPEMVRAITEWIDQPALAEQSAAYGAKAVAERYGWERLAEKLEQSLQRCAQSAKERRHD